MANTKTIEAIELFLEDWKNKARTFYTEMKAEYQTLLHTEFDITEDNLKEITRGYGGRRYSDEQIKNIMAKYNNGKMLSVELRNFKIAINSTKINIWEEQFSKSALEFIHSNKLEEDLQKELENKRKSFIKRVEGKVGTIIDATDLKVAKNGAVNGIVIGEKGKAEVNTVYAGGHTIQRLHYRVLVKDVK